MISPRSDVNERPHRFHPNDNQLQPSTIAYIAGRSLEYETAVRSCKHCSFSFRTGLNDPDIDGYCSKGSNIIHVLFFYRMSTAFLRHPSDVTRDTPDTLFSIVVKYTLIILHPSSSTIICNERDTFRHCLLSNLPLYF